MQNRLRSTRVVSQTAWVRSYAVRLAIAAGATSLPLGRLASADTTSRDTSFAHQFDTQSDPQVQAARQTYDTARQHVAELQSKIDQEQKALSDLAQRLSQADVSLSARHEALDNAEKALTEKQLALAEAEKEFESAKAAFEARWHDAIVRFEASGEFQSARSQADNARNNAAAAEDAALDRLGATGAFQRAMAAVNETSNKAKALAARPTNDPDRADAEQTAAEAAGRLAELRSRYLDEDVDVQSARANARAAGSAFDELSRSFRDQMPGLPEIASAKAASDGSASLLKTANQAVADSQVDRDHLAADFEQARAAFAADRATSAKLQGEVTDLNNQLAEANTHADQAQSSLTAALAAAEQNQQAALAFGPPPPPQPSVTVPVPSGVEAPTESPAAPPVPLQTPPAPESAPTDLQPPQGATPQPVAPPQGTYPQTPQYVQPYPGQAYVQAAPAPAYYAPPYESAPVYVEQPYYVSPGVYFGSGYYGRGYSSYPRQRYISPGPAYRFEARGARSSGGGRSYGHGHRR